MPQRKSTKDFGKAGEDFAAKLLISRGYKIVTRNFRSKFGEIDIVAKDNNTLVFVEVKTRWGRKFGSPQEAVTPQKLFKIRRTAEYFSFTHPTLPKKLRIDVVAIEIQNGKVTSSKIIKVD